MADFALAARGALAGRMPGAPTVADAAVMIGVRPDGPQALLIARRGKADALVERCSGFGVTLPMVPQRVESRGLGVVWTGPGQWLVEWEEQEAERAQRVFTSFASLCSVVRVDDARARFTIRGPRARDTLTKMLAIDLHPRVFRPDDAAVTVAGGISVIIWKRDHSPLYECAVPRSFAVSFWDWLLDSAAEYGVAVEG